MSAPPEFNIMTKAKNHSEGQHSDFLSPMNMSSNRKRSTSVTPSERSRITLVEEDPAIASAEAVKDPRGVLEIKVSAPKIKWIEHLLGVFCIELPRRKRMEVVERKFTSTLEPDSGLLDSPWIKSVIVLSYQAVDGHHTQKIAQCTIDTGNHQGNIVSRDFLVNVVGYPEDGFLELTDEEKRGGISATEHKLIPQGAVYLDWYYGTSPQVFRNMRFLVSPHSFCDLIIGARSIKKHNILGNPILAGKPAPENMVAAKDTRPEAAKKDHGAIAKLAHDIKKEVADLGAQAAKSPHKEKLDVDRKRLALLKAEHKHALAIEQKKDPTEDKKAVENARAKLAEAERVKKGEPATIPIASSSKTTTSGAEVKIAKPGMQ